jgi:FkbM family methyltransferase
MVEHKAFKHRSTPDDLAVLASVFRSKVYDVGRLPEMVAAGIRRRYDQLANPLIIDGGAFIGLSTFFFARAWPRAHVIAVEPEDENYDLCAENIAAERNVVLQQAALVGRRDAGQDMAVIPSERGKWAGRVERRPDVAFTTRQMAVGITVDSLVRKQCCDPFILKLDVEGSESDIFDGGHPCFLWPVVYVEPHDWLYPGRALSQSFLQWHVSHNADGGWEHRDLFIVDDVLCSVDVGMYA